MTLRLRQRTLWFLLGPVSAIVGCRSESVSAPNAQADTQPPVMVWLIGPAEPVNPGDSILVRFYAQDNVGLEGLRVRVQGAFELDWPLEFPEPSGQYTVIVNVPVPEGARVDVPAIVTLTVSDKAGLTADGAATVQLIDSREPTARLDVAALHDDGTVRTGELLNFYITAADNQRLTYIGYEVAGVRDSLPASGTLDSRPFWRTIPPSWVLQRPMLTGWSRDASGNLSRTGPASVRQIRVYDWVQHPVVTVPVSLDLAVRQVLWDEKRHTLFTLRNSVDGRGRIDEIDAFTGTLRNSISLPNYPVDAAFSPSGDSVVVALQYPPSLGIIQLLKPERSTMIVPLQVSEGWMPRAVLASGDHLFVGLFSYDNPGRLLDVNLGTGIQVIREDIDGSNEVSPYPILLQLPYGRLLVGAETEASGMPRFLYSAETDRFTRTSKFGAVAPRHFTSSPSGRFLMGSTLYNATLDSIGHAPGWDWSDPYTAALSPDGEALYQTTEYGYQKVRLSDGLLLEQVKLGMRPLRLIALADGSRLIAVAQAAVMIVDLR